MSNCPLTGSYPDYRQFSLQYGGDVEDYIGTSDAFFSGVYVWRPYKNADPVKEYFVKFGDVLVKRTIVTNNAEGKVYHNFINIFNEFTESRTGNNLTFSRSNKNLDVKVIDTTVPLTLGGGNSGINYCFSKTSCENNYRGAGTYRRTYLEATTSNIDFILAHHWYTTGNKLSLTKVGTSDKGVSFDGLSVVFDSDNNKSIMFDGVKTNGWALAISNDQTKIGSFNVTTMTINNDAFFSANIPVSIFIERSEEKIIITLNSMTRSVGIDTPRAVTITLDASYLSNNADFQIRDEENNVIPVTSESDATLTFTVTPSQNSNAYTITGSSVVNIDPIVTQESPENFFFTNFSGLSLVCSARDDNLIVNMAILLLNYSTISILKEENMNSQTAELAINATFPDGIYAWACRARDDSGRETISTYRNFIVQTIVPSNPANPMDPIIIVPPVVEEEDEEEVEQPSSSSNGGGGGKYNPPVKKEVPIIVKKETDTTNSKEDLEKETTSVPINEESSLDPTLENPQGIVQSPEKGSPTFRAFNRDIDVSAHVFSFIFGMIIIAAAVVLKIIKKNHGF
jgi:hypothetical protein